MNEFIDDLPKVELHLHLEGSLRPATMIHLADRNGADIGASTTRDLDTRYQFENFDEFLALFLTGLDVLRTAEDFADATVALSEELGQQQVRYAEVTTTPYSHHRRGILIDDYVEGLNEGRRLAKREHAVELAWICDIPREMEPADEGWTADFATSGAGPEGIVGLGLGGPEPGFPPELFTASFSRARAAGLGAVPHAGETEGPPSVWGALDSLGADRIGHGVRSVESEEVLTLLRQRGTLLVGHTSRWMSFSFRWEIKSGSSAERTP